jgi:hypothetical protein
LPGRANHQERVNGASDGINDTFKQIDRLLQGSVYGTSGLRASATASPAGCAIAARRGIAPSCAIAACGRLRLEITSLL